MSICCQWRITFQRVPLPNQEAQRAANKIRLYSFLKREISMQEVENTDFIYYISSLDYNIIYYTKLQ